VDLGASLDLVEHNLSIIRDQEQARVAMFMECNKKTEEVEPENTTLHPGDVESVLQELLSLSREEGEDLCDMNKFEMALAGLERGDTNKHSNDVYSVKTLVRTVLRRKPKKEKEMLNRLIWNLRGVGDKNKRYFVRETSDKHKLDLFGIQETIRQDFSETMLSSIGGDTDFN
jgi:hypothetical protein